MSNMPFVSNTSILTIMTDWLSVKAPFVTDRFWGIVKRNPELDSILFASIHGSEEEQHDAYRTLIVKLWGVVADCLAPAMVEELDRSLREWVVAAVGESVDGKGKTAIIQLA